MIERRHVFLIAGFAAALLFTGIPYWSLPYDANYLADPNQRLGFVALGVITALLAGSGAARPARLFWVMLAVFPVVTICRVLIDTAKDPTDHNLWPFELIFAAIVSLVAVVPGLVLGALARSFAART